MARTYTYIPGWVVTTCPHCREHCPVYHYPGMDLANSHVVAACKVRQAQHKTTAVDDYKRRHEAVVKRVAKRAINSQRLVSCNICGLVMVRQQAGNHLRFKHDKTSWDLITTEDFITNVGESI